MVDSLYADRGHVDDPHLWQRAERLGLDLDRFEADRRSDAVAARVRRDFESGIRAGVTSHPRGLRLSRRLVYSLSRKRTRVLKADGRHPGGRR